MLRVGYYLARVEMGAEHGGTDHYARRIIENLLNQPGHVAYHLFIDKTQIEYVRRLQARFAQRRLTWSTVRQVPMLLRVMGFLEMASLGQQGRRLCGPLRMLNYLEWQTLAHHVDLIHCPVQHLNTIYWRRPTIITMHDVQELHFPEFFTPAQRLARARLYWGALEAATKVVVSFDHVRDDLLRYFQLAPEKVHVCPPPITDDWFSSVGSADACSHYDLAPGFLLYPAQTWPHKNHIGLLRALAHLRDTSGLTPTLVCTGRQNDHFAAIKAERATLGLEQQVRFLGLVSSEELVDLYKKCYMVVVPTLYEAGSFPVIEAIMLKTPVICSQVTSLPDTIGDRDFTFDPHAPAAIAESIRLMLVNQAHYRRNVEHGALRRAAFAETPRQSADAFIDLYRSIARRQS